MNLNDKWSKCIVQGGNLHATAILGTATVETARLRHKLNSDETVALGESLMAGLLLASTSKQGERVSLSVKGSGRFKHVHVDADPNGTVRGFLVSQPGAALANTGNGPWHDGLLSVTRLKDQTKSPYIGTVPSITGFLAKDVTFYLSQSEQIPSAVGLAVNLRSGENPSVLSAGAFLLQVMPGASLDEIKLVEDNIKNMETLASQISHLTTPTELLGNLLNGLTFTILEEKPVQFKCNCTKERVLRALSLVSKEELQDMVAKDNGAEVSCDFCNEAYALGRSDLEKIIRKKG